VFTARYRLNLYTYSKIVSFLKVVIRQLGTPDPELVLLLRRSAGLLAGGVRMARDLCVATVR
jgi:hypothetical protein